MTAQTIWADSITNHPSRANIIRSQALIESLSPLIEKLQTLEIASESALPGIPPEYGQQAQFLLDMGLLTLAEFQLDNPEFTYQNRVDIITSKMQSYGVELFDEGYRAIADNAIYGSELDTDAKTLFRAGVSKSAAQFAVELKVVLDTLGLTTQGLEARVYISDSVRYWETYFINNASYLPPGTTLNEQLANISHIDLADILEYIETVELVDDWGRPIHRQQPANYDDLQAELAYYEYLVGTPEEIRNSLNAFEINFSPEIKKYDLIRLRNLISSLPDLIGDVSIQHIKQTLLDFEIQAGIKLNALETGHQLATNLNRQSLPLEDQYAFQLQDMYREEYNALPYHLRKELDIAEIDPIQMSREELGRLVERMVIDNPQYRFDDIVHKSNKINVLASTPNLHLDEIPPLLNLAFFLALDLFTPIGDLVSITVELLEGDFEGALQEVIWSVVPFGRIATMAEAYTGAALNVAKRFKSAAKDGLNVDDLIDGVQRLRDGGLKKLKEFEDKWLPSGFDGSFGRRPAYAGAYPSGALIQPTRPQRGIANAFSSKQGGNRKPRPKIQKTKDIEHSIVPYETKIVDNEREFERHHGVLDEWAQTNITGYNKQKAPTIILKKEAHDETRRVMGKWRYNKTGSINGYINWSSIDVREIQELTESMLKAAGVPDDIIRNYISEFHKYIYRDR